MPAPTTIPDLLDRLRRSGLVAPERIDGFLAGLEASGHPPATPREFLDRMVDAGMITRFHADRLAAGKYKGFQLGSYLILDQLGTGGTGQVYLAEHTAMQRLVALKVLPVFSTEDAVARERFLREARAAATLDHPNIVRVFDLCQEGKLLYLVMEYVEGISLSALVGQCGPLGIAAACHYARQVAFGLQHAHQLGFVHRDIRPANLLLDRTGIVKILDLGLIRSEADAAMGLTRQLDSRTVLGAADYVAPEQAVDSSSVDIRADLYSLGATLYYLLSGRPLFPDGRTAQKLVWQQVKEPVPIDRLRPEVSPELADVVHTLLQKRPEDRYQTPMEVFEALELFDHEDVRPPDESLVPAPPLRVMASRAVVAGGISARASSSTSQILSVAMRTGSGSSSGLDSDSGSRPRRPGSGSRPGAGGTSSVAFTPGQQPGVKYAGEETDAVAIDMTTRTPNTPIRLELDENEETPPPPWAMPRLVVLAAIALAAALAGLGLAVLATLAR